MLTLGSGWGLCLLKGCECKNNKLRVEGAHFYCSLGRSQSKYKSAAVKFKVDDSVAARRAFYIPFSSIVLWMTPQTPVDFSDTWTFPSFLCIRGVCPCAFCTHIQKDTMLFLPTLFFIFLAADCITYAPVPMWRKIGSRSLVIQFAFGRFFRVGECLCSFFTPRSRLA
jgi:hypothetical protein